MPKLSTLTPNTATSNQYPNLSQIPVGSQTINLYAAAKTGILLPTARVNVFNPNGGDHSNNIRLILDLGIVKKAKLLRTCAKSLIFFSKYRNIGCFLSLLVSIHQEQCRV